VENMSYDDEELRQYSEASNLKEVLKGGKKEGENTIKSEILAQDQFKQDVADGILQIERQLYPMENEETGEIYLQEFVRMEDGTGRWKQVSRISDKEWKELKKGGVANEQCAKDVLAHLNSLSNNNVSLSNLTQEQILTLGRDSELTLTDKLTNNRDDYDIQSEDDVKWIIDSIVRPNVMAGLSKAKNGALVRELLRETRLVGSLDDEEDDDGLLDSLR